MDTTASGMNVQITPDIKLENIRMARGKKITLQEWIKRYSLAKHNGKINNGCFLIVLIR
jgi:hypothetical protein